MRLRIDGPDYDDPSAEVERGLDQRSIAAVNSTCKASTGAAAHFDPAFISYASEDPAVMAGVGRPWALPQVPYTTTSNIVSGEHRNPARGQPSSASLTANQIRALVNRSWGLLGSPESSWGADFRGSEYDTAPSL